MDSVSKAIEYTLYDPSGNITALVFGKYDENDKRIISDRIMKSEPSCEQVGFVYFDAKNSSYAQLDMAGGEFCGNASMCAAIMLFCAHNSSLRAMECMVKCSGNDELLDISVIKKSENDFRVKLQLSSTEHVSGIYHQVIPLSGEPDRKDAEMKIKRSRDLLAKGYMFLDGNKLTPLVYVPVIDTLFWENSCASGCIAVASYLYENRRTEFEEDIIMPGGTIRIGVNSRGITLEEEIRVCRKCTQELKSL